MVTLEPVQHTRESNPENGPDFCRECSDAAQGWVAWPCPVVTAMETERLAAEAVSIGLRSLDRAREMTDDELRAYVEALSSADPIERAVAKSTLESGVPLRLDDPATIAKVAESLRINPDRSKP